MEKLSVYLGGDMLKVGSQMRREWEKKELERLGFKIYSPLDDKEINDKQNQTVEDNDSLALKIFDKGTKGMLDADILIFDVDNDNVGTTTEVGQWAMIHRLAKYEPDHWLQDLASKPIFFQNTDIRATDIPEKGYSRSFSINQYLHGAIQECNPLGIQKWEDIMVILGEHKAHLEALEADLKSGVL